MKNLIILGILVLAACLGSSCQDVTIGFLQTEDAGYNPDTMVVKKELDTTPPQLEEVDNPLYYELLAEDPNYYTPELLISWGILPTQIIEVGAGEDYQRAQWGTPWVSNPIEGVDGTTQIYVSIKDIKTTTGNAEKTWEYLKVYGDGTFEVPLEHDIPTGHYLISLNFKNEGYSKDVNDCFTIIVK
ncbi:hypothetical protein [Butyricimonas paravirosa]|uniref:hypothetical protein n=1 Tax=Butyricimonas paravirosa TaxID=1472417 RepID=UPI002A807511|nr:hypothetical protein [Butyricimonas paravirosa]